MNSRYFLLNTLVLFFFMFILNSSLASESNWGQWRGGFNEGASNAMAIPLNWSDSIHIAWKTVIEGKGHSSPVVENDNVIVTSSYLTKTKAKLNAIIKMGLLLLTVVLIVFLMVHIHKQSKYLNSFLLVNLIFVVAAGLLFGLFFFLIHADILYAEYLGFNHSSIEFRWFFQGVAVMLGLGLLLSFLKFKRGVNLLIAMFVLVLNLLIYYKRPFADYYPSEGRYIIDTVLKMLVLGLFVVLIALFKLKFRSKLTFLNKIRVNKIPLIKATFILAFSFSLVVGFFAINVYRFVLYDMPAGGFNWSAIDLFYRDGYIFFRVLALGCLLLLLSLGGNFIEFARKQSLIFSSIIILIAGLSFFKYNYLGKTEFVRTIVCVSKSSGQIKWTKELFPGEQPSVHADNSTATPTPIIINDSIYAYFGTPGLACLSAAGDVLWVNTNLPFKGIHGIGASPLYYQGNLIIASDMASDPYLVRLDCKTGQVIWKHKKVPWEGMHGEHRTPTIFEFKGRAYVLTWGKNEFVVNDFFSGKVVAKKDLPSNKYEVVSSVIKLNDSTVFASDLKYCYAIDFDALLNDEDDFINWKLYMHNKGPKCSSPVCYNGMIFTLSDNGFLSCLDARTGEMFWQERLSGIHLSSLNLVNENLYVSNLSGITKVIPALDTFSVISENKINEPIYSSFAVVDSSLILRGAETLFCIKQ